jgi:hypothetical protein
LARKVRLSEFRKQPRGPKKPQPKRRIEGQQNHVSTAKLLKVSLLRFTIGRRIDHRT